MKKRTIKKIRMSKRLLVLIALLSVTVGAAVFGLVACGEASEADVIEKLSSHLESSKGYLATGVMEVESEGQVHTYLVEVAFAQPEYYRVTMRNEATGNEQVILKNDDGVFVLTPALNKQFKFQSDWPLTSSQVYLYQSLLLDILNAETTVFEVLEDGYAFTIGATYHANGNLVEQEMHFARKTLTPTWVEVRDGEGIARMSMKFTEFEWNPTFDEHAFVAEAIMQTAQNVMGEGVITVASVEDELLYPTYVPEGTHLIDKTTIATTHGERVIMTFAGEHEFTIIQETARVREVFAPEHVMGEPVMVNGTVGAISDTTLTWQRNGVEFFLVSHTLEREQLLSVATSITEAYEK